MPSYTLIALTNPLEGQEEEFNRFYTEQHIPDVLRVPGVVAAQRFKICTDPTKAQYQYYAVYEIEADDVMAVAKEIGRRSGTPEMAKNPGQDKASYAAFFEPITERFTAK